MNAKIILFIGMMAGLAYPGISQKYFPIAEVSSGFLLGAAGSGHVIAMDSARYFCEKPMEYQYVNLNGHTGKAKGLGGVDMGMPCEGQYYIEFPGHTGKEAAIAVAGNWNLLPYPVVKTSLEQQLYKDATAAFLNELGLEQADIRLNAVIRTDLEGDGTDEVIIAAEFIRSDNPVRPYAGDYSVIFVRKLFNGSVVNIPLAAHVYPSASDELLLYQNTLIAIADIDGNGVMEVVIRTSYYEGEEYIIYHVAPNYPLILCGGGCGV